MTYDVIWDGSHQGCDRDLLCVHLQRVQHLERYPPVSRAIPVVETTHERTQRIREQLIRLMREKEHWTVLELRRRLDQPRLVINGILQRAKAVGVIRSVGYGVVTLARRDEAAA